jgi:hypothetical protein
MKNSDSPFIRVAGVRTAKEAHEFLEAGADIVSPRVDTAEGNPTDYRGAIPADEALGEFKDFSQKGKLGPEVMYRVEPEDVELLLEIGEGERLFSHFHSQTWDKEAFVQVNEDFRELVLTNTELFESVNARHFPSMLRSSVPDCGVQTYEIEVLNDYPGSWERMRATSQNHPYPTHRDLQLTIRDFDVFLLMDWTCDGILEEAPRLLQAAEGITVVVDHEDTRNWRISHAVDIEPAKQLVSEIDKAFQRVSSEDVQPRDSRPAHDIRRRSQFSRLLIVSEEPDETRDAVNHWYNNFRMEGFAEPERHFTGPPYVFLDRSVDVGEVVDGRDGAEAWGACHDIRYIERIAEIAEGSGARVYEWPEGVDFTSEALELLANSRQL